jgi:hypothetical protein
MDVGRILERFDQLISLGQGVLDQARQAKFDSYNDTIWIEGQYHEWRLASLSLIENLFGAESRFFTAYRLPEWFNVNDETKAAINKSLAAMRAARSEIEFGPLPHVESLVSAEIFEDFLSMAEHLLDQHYVPVVPSLVGAVLEDGLRKICREREHNVQVKESDNLASLNTKLFDAKVYSALVRKKIDVWTMLRNNADHGKFESNLEEDVRQMLEGVRQFLASHIK